MSEYKITKDNSKVVMQALSKQAKNGLEICGGKAESYAKKKAPVNNGTLRNSIGHKIDEATGTAYIGTNLNYAPFVELGTGIYYSGGRRTSWVYKDEKGNWHKTNGMKPHPYLKPAVTDHLTEYTRILANAIKGK